MADEAVEIQRFNPKDIISSMQKSYESNNGVMKEDIDNNLSKITFTASTLIKKGTSKEEVDLFFDEGFRRLSEFYQVSSERDVLTASVSAEIAKYKKRELEGGRTDVLGQFLKKQLDRL